MQCIPEGDYLFFRNQPAAAYCHATTYTRTSQIDKRSNESVITDVAQNNENLLVGTAFNSDAIHLGTSTRATPHARTCTLGNGISTGRMKSISEGRSGQDEGCSEKYANKIYFMSTGSSLN